MSQVCLINGGIQIKENSGVCVRLCGLGAAQNRSSWRVRLSSSLPHSWFWSRTCTIPVMYAWKTGNNLWVKKGWRRAWETCVFISLNNMDWKSFFVFLQLFRYVRTAFCKRKIKVNCLAYFSDRLRPLSRITLRHVIVSTVTRSTCMYVHDASPEKVCVGGSKLLWYILSF